MEKTHTYKWIIFVSAAVFVAACQSATNNENNVQKDSVPSVTMESTEASLKDNDMIETFYFDHGKTAISADDTLRLNKLANSLRSASYFLKVFGYTDTIGTAEDNDKLSEKRAMAIYDYLNTRVSVNQQQVYVTWIGGSEEVYDLHFPNAHPQQNCVDVWIIH
jgi:outer membrane protein OmpA-like peptidoglycan-associated protein